MAKMSDLQAENDALKEQLKMVREALNEIIAKHGQRITYRQYAVFVYGITENTLKKLIGVHNG